MAAKELERTKTGDSEKITINLGFVDLGHIDLLVQESFYANRTDFIRTAIRNQMERHADVVSRSVKRRRLELGLSHFGRAELEAAVAQGQRLEVQALGLVTIGGDVTPELAKKAFASIHVLGALHASPAVREALKDRIR